MLNFNVLRQLISKANARGEDELLNPPLPLNHEHVPWGQVKLSHSLGLHLLSGTTA